LHHSCRFSNASRIGSGRNSDTMLVILFWGPLGLDRDDSTLSISFFAVLSIRSSDHSPKVSLS